MSLDAIWIYKPKDWSYLLPPQKKLITILQLICCLWAFFLVEVEHPNVPNDVHRVPNGFFHKIVYCIYHFCRQTNG
jgi:hypothetical protein